jgi:hypothetical protein
MKALTSLFAFAGACVVGLAIMPGCSASSGPHGNGGGGNTVEGSVAGVSFTPVSSYGLASTVNGISGADVVMTNRADQICATYGDPNVQYASLALLELTFGELATGTYTFVDTLSPGGGNAGQGQTALGRLYVTDPQCGQVTDIYATSGSMTVSSFSPTAMAGTYTVSFGSQGTFTGAFDVDICPTPDGGILGNGMAPTCQP